MATIDEMSSNMTIFYNKRMGRLKCISTGIQDMTTFGDEAEDYSLIWDYGVYPLDDFVINNMNKFLININTKQLEMKSDSIPQYPIASV